MTSFKPSPTILGPIAAFLALGLACVPYVPPRGGPGAGAREEDPPRERRELPPGSHEGQQESLLAAYVDREAPTDAEMDDWGLPRSAKRVAVSLLIAAAQDDVALLEPLLTTDARWGIPDRREPRAVDVDTDAEAFFTAFRDAASRFKGKANFSCPPLMPGAEIAASIGGEPMWCYYGSDDGMDLLVYKLVVRDDHPRIAYVGLFPERPTGPMRIQGYGNPPPTAPPPKMRGMENLSSGVSGQTPSRLIRGGATPGSAGGIPVRQLQGGTPPPAGR